MTGNQYDGRTDSTQAGVHDTERTAQEHKTWEAVTVDVWCRPQGIKQSLTGPSDDQSKSTANQMIEDQFKNLTPEFYQMNAEQFKRLKEFEKGLTQGDLKLLKESLEGLSNQDKQKITKTANDYLKQYGFNVETSPEGTVLIHKDGGTIAVDSEGRDSGFVHDPFAQKAGCFGTDHFEIGTDAMLAKMSGELSRDMYEDHRTAAYNDRVKTGVMISSDTSDPKCAPPIDTRHRVEPVPILYYR